MMIYSIREVDARNHLAAETIHRFNRLAPDVFPDLESRHLDNGYWWLAWLDGEPIAFAGLVLFEPFPQIGYCKRCYINPDHRGHGLQLRLLVTREIRARQLGWTHLISECSARNHHSSANFRRAGFEQCEPEQRWGVPDSIYWIKQIE
jgi:GNAT superfamily N-acetyltransferase